MARYNTQKYSKGRSLNRENKKDSFSVTNNIYLLQQLEDVSFYIDSIYKEDEIGFHGEEGINYKSIYVVKNKDIKDGKPNNMIKFCYIDDTVSIDCDFMDNLPKIYEKTLKRINIIDVNDKSYESFEIYTLLSPSSYDSISTVREEIEGMKGFYLREGSFNLMKSNENKWMFYGHSQHLVNKDGSKINIKKLKKMNSIEFYNYFTNELIYY